MAGSRRHHLRQPSAGLLSAPTTQSPPLRPPDLFRDLDESDFKRPEEDQHKATPDPGPSPAQYHRNLDTGKYQPAAQQTPTTNYYYAGIEKSLAEHRLKMAQRRKELLETAKLEESSITNASLPQSPSRKELLDTITPMESSITSASSSSLPQSPLRKELLVTTTLDESWITKASYFPLPQSPSCEVPDLLALKLHNALMLSSFVCSMVPTGLFIKYFARMDKEGFFHTYPDRDGAFRTLEEAQKAIDTHHAVQRKNMCMEGLSDEEMAVRNALYWYYDGTRKHSAEAFASVTTRRPTRELVKALLDTHNEHNNLLGDDAYELIDIVREKECFDGKGCIYRSYSHFNLTLKTKGADANSDLYFAEVTCMRGDYEAYVLTCLCVVKPDEKNGKCNVCEVSMKDMKHPTDDVYNQGRPPKFQVRRPQRSAINGVDLFEKLYAVHDEAWLNAEEARVRRMVKEEMEAMKLEVNKRGDEMIKEVKESRCKLEVGNRRGGHEKKDTYVMPARRK